MKRIPKAIREFVDYDEDTGAFTWAKDIGTRFRAGGSAGCRQQDGYYRIGFNGGTYYAHRVAWFLAYGEEPDHEIDHVNGDRSDNRLVNLRAATRLENTRNTKVWRKSSTGVKGVHMRKDTGSFRAHCRVDGVVHWLGTFKTLEEAQAVVRAFREKNHREFHNHG